MIYFVDPLSLTYSTDSQDCPEDSYVIVEADNKDGWITRSEFEGVARDGEWEPVHREATIDIIFNNGEVCLETRPYLWMWGHDPEYPERIAAFRFVEDRDGFSQEDIDAQDKALTQRLEVADKEYELLYDIPEETKDMTLLHYILELATQCDVVFCIERGEYMILGDDFTEYRFDNPQDAVTALDKLCEAQQALGKAKSSMKI